MVVDINADAASSLYKPKEDDKINVDARVVERFSSNKATSLLQ